MNLFFGEWLICINIHSEAITEAILSGAFYAWIFCDVFNVATLKSSSIDCSL